jgi:hypothetical protein
MFRTISTESGRVPVDAERRVYHAQLLTFLAVLPSLMGLTTLVTAASMGDRELRAVLLAPSLAVAPAFAIAVLFLLAWWLLGRRHRAGVLLAAPLFAWMVYSDIVRASPSYPGIIFGAVGLIVAVRAWPAMRRT